MIGNADKNISDVLASIQEDYASAGEEFATDIGSLQLSETQSQSVDGTELVTQAADVPEQLRADKERRSKKIHDARIRKEKSLQGKSDGLLVPIDGTAAGSVVPLPHKSRSAIRKVKQSEIVSPRRSPRIVASTVDVRPHQSPRVSSILKDDAAAASKAASIDKGKNVKKRVATKKVAAVVVKKGVSKGIKDTKVASKASGSGKKLQRKVTKSSRSDKDEDYKGDNESEDFEDTDPNQVSIFIHLYRMCIILLLYLYLCYHKCKLNYFLVLYFMYLYCELPYLVVVYFLLYIYYELIPFSTMIFCWCIHVAILGVS
jgi:hypothetical protein